MKIIRLTTLISIFILLLAGCEQEKNSQQTKNSKPMDTTQAKENNSDPFQSGYLPVNGISMYYEIHGAGKPLVLIHGGGSTIGTSFGRILPLLAKKYKIIAVELQAHGHTSDRDAPESFDQDADDVAELLKQLNIQPVDILGFSNGGQTALKIAIRHPELVHKLVVASAFYKRDGVPEQFWQGMNNATFGDMPQPYKDEFLKIKNDQSALLNMFNKDATRMRTFKDWSDEDLKSIKAPVLFLSGDTDVALPEHTIKMSRLVAHSRLAIIPGGHGTYIGELTTLTDGKWTQDFVTPLIEQFLDSRGN